MKCILYRLTLCLLVLFFETHADAQNMLEQVTKFEKAVFTISSYDSHKNEIASRTGFFISSDGIAIAPANIFLHSDSISLTLRNGRTYGISKILSTHRMANLIIFKVLDHRQKGFEYIIPSQESEKSHNEVLILSHPKEAAAGISLGVITNVYQAPYLDRIVKVDADFGPKSEGAPVMNNEGAFIGIASFLAKSNTRQYLSTHIINDTLWTHHTSTKNWKKTIQHKNTKNLYPNMLQGISNFMNANWVEAAKYFSYEIKQDSSNIIPFILRGEARRNYENYIGMRSDYAYAKQLNPEHFLIHYYEALEFVRTKDDSKAFTSLIACIQHHEYFSPALVQFGLLVLKLHHDILTAKRCYEQAIKSTPLYANGYYEMSRLSIQYLNDNETALKDIAKAISLNQLLPGAYSIRGTLRIQTQNYLEAISDLDKAIEIDSADTHALFNRGLAYYNLGMKQKCCKDWDTAGQMGHYKSIKYLSRYCNKTPLPRSNNR